jgi:gas vesicle protein
MKKEQEVLNSEVNENSSTKDFLLGAVIGGLVGAATALFLAPKPGKELRNDLNQHADVLKEKGIKLTGTVKEKGTEFITIAKDKTDHLTNVVSKHSTDLIDKVKGVNSTEKETTSEVFEVQKEEADDLKIAQSKDDFDEIQQKLEETKKAFDETESKYN